MAFGQCVSLPGVEEDLDLPRFKFFRNPERIGVFTPRGFFSICLSSLGDPHLEEGVCVARSFCKIETSYLNARTKAKLRGQLDYFLIKESLDKVALYSFFQLISDDLCKLGYPVCLDFNLIIFSDFSKKQKVYSFRLKESFFELKVEIRMYDDKLLF